MNSIDIKDITCGSLVLFQGLTCQIVEIDCNDQQVSLKSTVTNGNFWYIDIKELQPIPLDPFWCEAFGFQPEGSFHYTRSFEDRQYTILSVHPLQVGFLRSMAYLTNLTGVHHLQNLLWHLERIWLSIEQKGGQG